jgi:hypothetical protein
MNHPKFL